MYVEVVCFLVKVMSWGICCSALQNPPLLSMSELVSQCSMKLRDIAEELCGCEPQMLETSYSKTRSDTVYLVCESQDWVKMGLVSHTYCLTVLQLPCMSQ